MRKLLLALALTAALHAEPVPWGRDPVLYELNTRQFTPQGTFRAVLPRIPELKRLGVDIVWFMPIHPIGEVQRKGRLGSPYAVRDYYGINPEFGDLEDFKALVDAIHAAGMRVIIDLVANHTAWDHPWTREHPEWYVHGPDGKFMPPVADWTDVIKLDYNQPGLRLAMKEMLQYWVRDVGIDGFRADVAGEVPTSFWNEARAQLGDVFMLAEAEKPELLERAFDCDYASELFVLFDKIAHGQASPAEIDKLVRDPRYPPGSERMLFTSNHDQNSWWDSDINRLGEEGSKAFATLAFTLPGKPLIYNGQEVGNRKKLAFFERDPIVWKPSPRREFYSHLSKLHHELGDLSYRPLRNSKPGQVFAFRRGNEFVIVANLSKASVEAKIEQLREPQLLGPWEVRVLRGPLVDHLLENAQLTISSVLEYDVHLAPLQREAFAYDAR